MPPLIVSAHLSISSYTLYIRYIYITYVVHTHCIYGTVNQQTFAEVSAGGVELKMEGRGNLLGGDRQKVKHL